ncbi:vegetative cell wall protein gp1-like [Oryx dammah]|uniref:vegetative cell wall protein gp1-like n=1 Tax=Oryx dammah TaxID=59534 RepID=UPI001A9AB9CC|nr:vegetative cell wall protein gp1-like [Oryx dammah]
MCEPAELGSCSQGSDVLELPPPPSLGPPYWTHSTGGHRTNSKTEVSRTMIQRLAEDIYGRWAQVRDTARSSHFGKCQARAAPGLLSPPAAPPSTPGSSSSSLLPPGWGEPAPEAPAPPPRRPLALWRRRSARERATRDLSSQLPPAPWNPLTIPEPPPTPESLPGPEHPRAASRSPPPPPAAAPPPPPRRSGLPRPPLPRSPLPSAPASHCVL